MKLSNKWRNYTVLVGAVLFAGVVPHVNAEAPHVKSNKSTVLAISDGSSGGGSTPDAGAQRNGVDYPNYNATRYRSAMFTDSTFSVTMWMRIDGSTTNTDAVIFEFDGVGTEGVMLDTNTLRVVNMGGGFATTINASKTFDPNKWYFVAYTRNGTAGNLYWGDESTVATATAGTVQSLSGNYVFGINGDVSTSSFTCGCQYAFIKTWDATLNSSEIEAEQYSIAPVRSANLLARYDNQNGAVVAAGTDQGPNGLTTTKINATPVTYTTVTGPTF